MPYADEELGRVECPTCGGQVVARGGRWGVYGGCDTCWVAYHRDSLEAFVDAVERRDDVRVPDAE